MLLQCLGKGPDEQLAGGEQEQDLGPECPPSQATASTTTAAAAAVARSCNVPFGGTVTWHGRDAASHLSRIKHLMRTTYDRIDENSNLEYVLDRGGDQDFLSLSLSVWPGMCIPLPTRPRHYRLS